MQVRKQQLELDMEQQTDWFQIGKGSRQEYWSECCAFIIDCSHTYRCQLIVVRLAITRAKKQQAMISLEAFIFQGEICTCMCLHTYVLCIYAI